MAPTDDLVLVGAAAVAVDIETAGARTAEAATKGTATNIAVRLVGLVRLVGFVWAARSCELVFVIGNFHSPLFNENRTLDFDLVHEGSENASDNEIGCCRISAVVDRYESGACSLGS